MITPQSGSALHVGTLRSRFVSARPIDDAQVRQWHEAFADQDASDLVGRTVADDEWLLIRRLPLKLRWRPDAPQAEVGHAWMQGLQRAVEGLADDTDERQVLRYRVWRHGLADLLYRSALGETNRQWAWRRMGLIAGEDIAPADALQQGSATLLAQPELIWPVLHQCLRAEAETGAFTALARRVPAGMWRQWLAAAPQTRGWMRLVDDDGAERGSALADAGGDAGGTGRDMADMEVDASGADAALRPLLDMARRHPRWAQGMGDGLSAWLAALAWPSSGDADRGLRRLRAVRVLWRRGAAGIGVMGLRATSRTRPEEASAPALAPPASTDQEAVHGLHDAPDDEIASADRGTEPSGPDVPSAPDMPAQDVTVATAWAGALFWLRHLALPGVLDGLLADATMAARDVHERAAGLLDASGHALCDVRGDARGDALGDAPGDAGSADGLLMHAIAKALHVPVDDPVMHILTAGQPESPVPPSLQAAADALVARWSAWLDAAMPDAPEPRMDWVCRRPGRLKAEPGWIELLLDIDQIDTRIRRIGLDLDPGWVPFIGAVVRIRYE